MAAPAPKIVSLTHGDLIDDAKTGFHLTTRLLAENAVARDLRNFANAQVYSAAVRTMNPHGVARVRAALAPAMAWESIGAENNQMATTTHTRQHYDALSIGSNGIVGGGKGGEFIDPMKVATRSRMALKQGIITQQFTAGDFTNWVQTMAQIGNEGRGNEAFMAQFNKVVAPVGAHLAEISDAEVTALRARQAALADRYGTSDTITMALDSGSA